MNYLIISFYFWPESFRVNELVEELVSKGKDVTVLTGYPNYHTGDFDQDFVKNPKKYKNYKGAKVVRFPLIPRKKNHFFLALNYLSFVLMSSTLGVYKLRNKKIDHIFIFGASPIFVGIPGLILKKLKKAKLVYWVLDLWPETLQALNILKSKFSLGLIAKIVEWVYGGSDKVLYQSKEFKKPILKYAKDTSKLQYFPSWSENIFRNESVLAKEIKEEKEKFNVLFAGNIGAAQDFPSIFEAMKLLKSEKDIRWIIVGNGRMHSWLKENIEKEGLTDQVVLAGQHPLEKMPDFFKHADALLVSLIKDDFVSLTIPGKIQSYLYSKKPILGMLDNAGKNVIEESKSGLTCHAGDSENLAQNILKLKNLTQEEREKLGQNGFDYAEVYFNRDKQVQELINIFDQLK